jgi:acetolactate synthase small subunit
MLRSFNVMLGTELHAVAETANKPKPGFPPALRPSTFCFSLLAHADPGVMPRVLELFAKRNIVPDRWHSDRAGPRGEKLTIDLQVQGLEPDKGDYIARCLRQIWGVETVLTAVKS